MQRWAGRALLSGLLCAAGCAAPTPVPAPPAASATRAQPTDTPRPIGPTVEPTRSAATTVSAGVSTPAVEATATPAATFTLLPSPTDTAPAPSATSPPAIVNITYRDFEIVPARMTIKAGTTVIFLIEAGLFIFHQPYNFTRPNVFEAPPNLGSGATYSYTFSEPGTMTLLCGYHAEMSMTLTVEP